MTRKAMNRYDINSGVKCTTEARGKRRVKVYQRIHRHLDVVPTTPVPRGAGIGISLPLLLCC